MKFSILTTWSALAMATPAFAAPAQPDKTPAANTSCKNPSKRIEWRKLDAADQKSYLDAVTCLKTKPSRRGMKTPLYDDFAYVHFQLNTYIHGGPPFLPWHRYFGKVYEDALRECGYKGPGTYWDWTQDTDGLRFSPVMSSKQGFGGNGNPDKVEYSPDGSQIKCVTSGPFSKLRPSYLAISPTTITADGHCLWRNLPEVSEPDAWETMRQVIKPASIQEVQSTKNWTSYHTLLEGSPHGTIHASLGGDMNPTTSPNEPLFFLHHAQIDRLWWLWQQKNPSKRLSEYSGEHMHYKEQGSRKVKLNDTLAMMGLAADVKVRDVMDIHNDRLCFTYE